ncbi:MAG: RecX family transcriptional regulator [Christensenellaceae bacterium]|nr:RecX family transcriptional regulator [Christensenellaceae bacterium]
MRKAKTQSSAYDMALDYLTSKARTVREMELRLDEGDYSEIEIMQTVDRLIGSGLLDDRKYAEAFIETRLNTKPVSRRKLREQLEGHFVPDDIIKDALNVVSDDVENANAKSVAEKYFRQFSSLELSERFRRVGLRLASRGYTYDCIKLVLSELGDQVDDAPEDDSNDYE